MSGTLTRDQIKNTVPGKFQWGVATSSHQIEGYNDKNDWWDFEAQGNIEGGAKSGAATDHWNRFPEDIKLAAELGVTSYRFSIEWSRIEPSEGKWDESALDWYANLITECEKYGIMPMLTLHHFTSPQWFAAKGGFAWGEAPTRFSIYVKKVVTRLGSRVPVWCTLNEPMVLVGGTYLGRFMPPAQYSPQLASKACHGLLTCHALAYDIIHSEIKNREGPWKDHPIEVGIAHNMLDFKADRWWHPLEQVLRFVFNRFYNQSWLDAITGRRQIFGVWGLVPFPPQVREARGRKTADFIGINYYTKAYVQWHPRSAALERPSDLPLGITFARRKEVTSDLEWAIHPKGFRNILNLVAKYKLPIYITENGIADKEDAHRPDFLFSHLRELARAMERGIDVRGYYHWSLLDNFEWIKGFGPRFGLFKVNYDTFERTPTRSAEQYKKIIESHKNRKNASPSTDYFQ